METPKSQWRDVANFVAIGLEEQAVKYLLNTWYAAARSHELGDNVIGRTYLDHPVVLFRDAEHRAAALADICPHRFAPLSQGKLRSNTIECPYHGLRFDSSGACVLNPQGNKIIPRRATVRVYPTLERYGVIWIWMGDSAAADPELLPDFSPLVDSDTYGVVHGYLKLDVNYQLLIDNLMDLSHVEFLHSMIGVAGASTRTEFEMKQEGNTVFAYNYISDEPITPLAKMIWDTDATVGDRRAHIRWDPPGNMLLDAGVTRRGRPPSDGLSTPSAHLLTPETETTTHYFWAHCRDKKAEDLELSKRLHDTINAIFQSEDGAMMSACQERMTSLDLLAQKPIILSTDGAAVRARKILKACIEAEGRTKQKSLADASA